MIPKRSINLRFHKIKYAAGFLLSSGVIIWDQVRRAKQRLRNSTSPHVWQKSVPSPDFIYIEDDKYSDLLEKFKASVFTNEIYKIAQFFLWIATKFKGSQVYEDIFALHQNLAWRFLSLAQSDNYCHRLRAIHTLASMTSLSDSTCRQLAQACNSRTAVGLARSENVDLRLLLDPPKLGRCLDRNDLVKRLYKFLLALDAESTHPCLQYVITKVFYDSDTATFDDDLVLKVKQPDVIVRAVEAILHHSWLGSNSQAIVSLGGLPLLSDIYRLMVNEEDNLDILIGLSRILSNVSMNSDLHHQLYMAGCIKILAALLQHGDVRVNVPAARALMNCDTDLVSYKSNHLRFLRNVYVLHPLHRHPNDPANEPLVDVIFVHGLLGGVFVTWRQRDSSLLTHSLPSKNLTDLPTDSNIPLSKSFQLTRNDSEDTEERKTQCWPRDWLPKDCHKLRVLGVNYDTNISMWSPMCPIAPARLTVADRSEHLISVLSEAGVGGRPIVWIAHSMGGLIVKDLLVKCKKSSDFKRKDILEQTKSIIFCSTPHRGSQLASLNTPGQLIVWPTVEVHQLRQDSPQLLQLHGEFIKLTEEFPLEVVSFAEREPTFVRALKMKLRFVDDASSDAGVGELYGVPLDHLCVCKPASRNSFLYRKVVETIKNITSKHCSKSSASP